RGPAARSRRHLRLCRAHRDDYLLRLFDYLRRPSISTHGVGMNEVASYIAEVMTRIGPETAILPTAARAGPWWSDTLPRSQIGQRCFSPGTTTCSAGSAGGVDLAALRASDPWRAALRARGGRQQGAALRQPAGAGGMAGLPRHAALQLDTLTG